MFKKLIKAFSALVLVAVVATSAFAGPDAHEHLNADSLAFTRLISVRSYTADTAAAIIPWDFKDHVINQNNGADMGGGTNRAEFIFFTRPNISIRPSVDQTIALEIWGR